MSNVGEHCDRKLWFHVNHYEEGEKLSPEVRFKFLYGDILEETVLYLAKEAGHTVEGEQDTLEIAGVKGHRDAVIDGVLVDVKSASSYSFQRFSQGLDRANDKFGYISQLQLYLHGSRDDPIVTDKDRAAFLVIDKTLGKICLDIHKKQDINWEQVVERKKALVASSTVPGRGYTDVADGASGNRKLDTSCSYCPFKHMCWPGLRTFIYSSGPAFLTRVVREPRVPEVNG